MGEEGNQESHTGASYNSALSHPVPPILTTSVKTGVNAATILQ